MKKDIRSIVIIALLFLTSLILAACQNETPSNSPGKETPSENPVVRITPVGAIDLTGLELYWQHDNLYFAPDDQARLSLFIRADKDNSGNFLFDDGQDWLLVMETSLGNYPLFPRRYVQLGTVSCTVFIDLADYFHVLVTVRQGAGYQVFDCVFDNDEKAFMVENVYDASGINVIVSSD